MTVADSPIPSFHLAMPVDEHDVPVPKFAFADDSQAFAA
jgi:hypothetical protein